MGDESESVESGFESPVSVFRFVVGIDAGHSSDGSRWSSVLSPQANEEEDGGLCRAGDG